ncbi:MAG: spore coat biosynthesis protein F [Leptospiraceae bacterium]|nr:spore coat biosynthesis protein F [Leptospiraceae bacterium]
MSGIHLTLKVFAFIQARTGSTRFAGKVLKSFTKSPDWCILDHIIFRLEKVLPKENIILLIPKNDSPLKEYADKNRINYFEGDENDVRSRFIEASKKFNPEWILRLTADNPFLDLEHLELLIESTFTTTADLLSFAGLPLGATGEIFKREALINFPEEKLENRHREHVSLHIKEFTDYYTVIKLKNLIPPQFHSIIPNIRITIDESDDMELCNSIFENLKNNPTFGVKEIIDLYQINKDLFLKNINVNQVTFTIPKFDFIKEKKILIIYGNKEEFGTGHYERMKFLYVYLQSISYPCEIRSNLEEIPDNFDLYILDSRDIEIPGDLKNKKWLLVDHYGKDNNYINFYSLPHPSLKIKKINENFLAPFILNTFAPGDQKENYVLVYAGNLKEKETHKLDQMVFNLFPNQNIYRIGGYDKSNLKNVKIMQRLTRFEFYIKLNFCNAFINYFGQSIMEALILKKAIYIYSISDYHTELAKYLEKYTDINFLGNVFEENFVADFTYDKKLENEENFSNLGFSKLIKLVDEIN